MERLEERKNALFEQVSDYADKYELESMMKTLPFIDECMSGKARSEAVRSSQLQDLIHCLEVCVMLMDLQINISPEDKDDLMSAVILHVYPEHVPIEDLEKRMVGELGFNQRIFKLVTTMLPDRNQSNDAQNEYYQKIQEDPLALLAVLADRGNIIQHLYQYSTWNAHRYIDETKACYYPMCIYGKEHYYPLMATIGILMEKLKSLIEVAEILLRRYEAREADLLTDILAMKEENAVMRGIIAKFQAQAAE